MSGMTPLHPDDARSARAWAAFVKDDAAATAPPSLEARVMRAAHAALAQKQRDDAERRRRHWFAGCSAIAATLLAAAAWSLAPSGAQTASDLENPGRTAAPATSAATAAAPAAQAPMAFADEDPGPPMPMTNVEAGRVLATPPQRLLATRPLFDAVDGVGAVRAPARLRARSFGAPTVEPVFTNGRPTHSIPDATATAPALAAAPAPTPLLPAPMNGTAPPTEVWSSRSFDGVFDPATTDKPVPPPIRLDQAVPNPTPREDPPAPPK